ncbi:MAG: endolytic transglycosylase MltG [Acidimicrobiia bacterium]
MTDHWTNQRDPADDWDLEEPWAEGEWEDYREPSGTGKRFAVVLAVLLVVLAIIAGAGLFAWGEVQDRIDPPGPPGEPVAVTIPNGSTTEDIGALLADEGVISSSTVWGYWTRLNSVGPFQAGDYEFRTNMSFDEAVDVLDQGPRPPELERVTIPEGLTVAEILPRLADGVDRWTLEGFQAAIDSGEVRSAFQPPEVTSLEGLLFPDTYEIDEDVDEKAFLQRLVGEMDARLRALDIEARSAELGRTPYEIITIASLIEEETRVPAERGQVARVVYNRLEEGIPLGIDATSRYEAEISGRSREDLDFESDSPYNTRRIAGLPPTPIAAPGQASLEGALNPVDGPWIYYVLQDEQGNHFFTESFQEFNRAKAECARQGLGCG